MLEKQEKHLQGTHLGKDQQIPLIRKSAQHSLTFDRACRAAPRKVKDLQGTGLGEDPQLSWTFGGALRYFSEGRMCSSLAAHPSLGVRRSEAEELWFVVAEALITAAVVNEVAGRAGRYALASTSQSHTREDKSPEELEKTSTEAQLRSADTSVYVTVPYYDECY